MSYEWMGAASREWLRTAKTDAAAVADADRASAALRADYQRWSRWALGLAAYIVAAVGLFLSIGLIVSAPGQPFAPVDIIVVVVSVAVTVFAIVVLVRLWLTGRRLCSATAWWMRLPYVSGGRQRRATEWIAARIVNFEPRVFIRIMTASLAFLVAIFGVALFVRGVIEGIDGFSLAAGAVGVFSMICGLGQLGGVMRLVAAVGEGDPLWGRIRSRV